MKQIDVKYCGRMREDDSRLQAPCFNSFAEAEGTVEGKEFKARWTYINSSSGGWYFGYAPKLTKGEIISVSRKLNSIYNPRYGMKTFNLKLEFKDGKAIRLTSGTFGVVQTDKPKNPVDKMSIEDSYIAWPVNPEFTGKWGILSMLQIPVADQIQFVGFSH